MTWNFTALLVTVVLPLAAHAQPKMAYEATACSERLERSLAEMERRPLLKEELATGLMWLRLDAEMALKGGDTTLCLSKVETVEIILGINEPTDYFGE